MTIEEIKQFEKTYRDFRKNIKANKNILDGTIYIDKRSAMQIVKYINYLKQQAK